MRGIWILVLLVVLNLFAKPSFLFCFVAVYPLFMLREAFRRASFRIFLLNMIPVVVAGVLIAAMYLLIYVFSFSAINAGHVGRSGVAISPLAVWRKFSPNIALSLALSLLFPVVYLLTRPRELFDPLLQYAWSLYCVALLVFAVFTETGPRAFHGNFSWQAIVCAYILFFVTALRFGRRLLSPERRPIANLLVAIAIAAHVVAGAVYIVAILVRRHCS